MILKLSSKQALELFNLGGGVNFTKFSKNVKKTEHSKIPA